MFNQMYLFITWTRVHESKAHVSQIKKLIKISLHVSNTLGYFINIQFY